MTGWRTLRMASVALLTSIAPLGGGAFAQMSLPYVPPEHYPEIRWLQGDKLRFCIWQVSPTYELDRMIGQEIANVLLLDVEFYEYTSTMPLDPFDFWEAVYIQLARHCNAIMGFTMSVEIEADWLTPTRPYYEAPFVFAVTSEDYDSLGDVPFGQPVGAVLHSDGDRRMVEYMQLQPEDQRWIRFPFTDGEQALRFLLDGRVEGAIFWAPTLFQVTGGDYEAHNIRVVGIDPLRPASTPVGMMLRSYNVFLRNQIDQAIGALNDDGVMAKVLESLNFPGATDLNRPHAR